MGLARDPHGDEVLQQLAMIPVKDGIYVTNAAQPLRLTGILGLMAPSKAVTLEMATRTQAIENELRKPQQRWVPFSIQAWVERVLWVGWMPSAK